MRLMESIVTTRRNPFKATLQMESITTQPTLRQYKLRSLQPKPKKSLIRINPKKFPNDFFDKKQTLMSKKIPKFKRQTPLELRVEKQQDKLLSINRGFSQHKNQQKFKRTSFFKFSEENSDIHTSRTSRNILSRSESKRAQKRWKRTADSYRNVQMDNLTSKNEFYQNGLLRCTFSKILSKQSSTDGQSPTCDSQDLSNVFGSNNSKYEKGYFRLGHLQSFQLKQPEIAKTERFERELRIRRKMNPGLLPLEHFPPISFR